MKRKNDSVIELSLVDRLKRRSALLLLKSVLVGLGVSPQKIVEYDDGLSARVSVYLKSRLEAQELSRKLSKVKLNGIFVKLKTLKKKDWLDKWKEDFRTFALTKTIDDVPVKEKGRYKPTKRKPIFLETSSAFGSGLHETTRFMANLIERCRGQFENFLDIGTGTGILSFVAFHCGAKKIQAIDIDKHCVKTARANFILNDYSLRSVKVADIGRLKGSRDVDFVAANLITLELIRLKKNILSFVKPKKFLAVSGISLENFWHFQKAFKNLPLRTLRVVKGREWAAVLYRRKDKG